jgi:hypothetical protein
MGCRAIGWMDNGEIVCLRTYVLFIKSQRFGQNLVQQVALKIGHFIFVKLYDLFLIINSYKGEK